LIVTFASVTTTGQFDLEALADAIDTQRSALGLTWRQVTEAVRPRRLGPVPQGEHPMSTSAITGMRRKRFANSAIVLQILLWLDRTPESFLAGNDVVARPGDALTRCKPGMTLRFDALALHKAVDERRRERSITWQEAATEMPGVTVSVLAGLRRGSPAAVGFPHVMSITQWLGRPAAAFTRCFAH
jgi:hypothetical protein